MPISYYETRRRDIQFIICFVRILNAKLKSEEVHIAVVVIVAVVEVVVVVVVVLVLVVVVV